jgi:hypothetical protein
MKNKYDKMSREEEVADRRRRKEEFIPKITGVASQLGYVAVERKDFSDPTIEMTGQGDISIWVRICAYGWEDKIEIWGKYPQSPDNKWSNNYSACSIGVAETSDVDHIVSHIKRRFLPKYLESLSKAKAQVVKIQGWVEGRTLALSELVTASGGRSWSHTGRKLDEQISFNGGSIKFTNVESEDEELTITLTVDEAKAVFNLLHERRKS